MHALENFDDLSVQGGQGLGTEVQTIWAKDFTRGSSRPRTRSRGLHHW